MTNFSHALLTIPQHIQDRIKELDFQDCKVRVSNVDSQASHDNIVIQVIGETSNKAGAPKKFVQTFVLAQQPSGYFVLNDILRYIDEESDDEPTEAAREKDAAAQEPVAVTAAETKEEAAAPAAEPTEASAPALDAGVVDQKLEEVTKETATEDVAKAQVPAETTATAVETAAKPQAEQVPDPDTTAREVAEEAAKEVEKPADPSPTPVQTRQPPPAPAAAPVAAPAQPPKPMTWASRAAAAANPRPVVPLPKTASPAAQPRPAAPAQPAAAQAAAPVTQAAVEPSTPAAPAKDAPTEWQTAGADSKRQNRPQSISGPQHDKEGKMGYVKFVNDKVKSEDLQAALAQHGELSYFDINRQKVSCQDHVYTIITLTKSQSCAFVEFASPAGYQSAIAANPHTVNGESVVVEPRRPKAGAYGGSNYTAGRGNASNRGRGGFDGNRSGSQGGRGGFGGQNRPRGGAARGRGASQATNA